MSKFDKHILQCYYICNNIFYNKKNTLINKAIIKLLYIYYSFLLKYLYGSFIPYRARIGKNVNFIHSFHGVFISQTAIIGDNCKILHHVTIGSNIQKNNPIESPIIGNDVFIGCNCCIIGKAEIRDNCRIGAGAVITNKIIKENSLVYSNNLVVVEGIKC